MNKLAVSASCLLVSLLSGNVLADEPAPLALGTRLRETADQIVVGRLVAQDDKSLTLIINNGRDRAVVPRARITTLERSLRPSKKGTGAATGAVVGALFSGFVGLAAGGDCSGGMVIICFPPYAAALVSSLVLVPLGALIGTVAAHGERWEVISGHQRLALRVAPTRSGGMTAAVSLRF
jgi:hypothetical protein